MPQIGAATIAQFLRADANHHSVGGQFLHQTLIERARAEFGADFWGFWMLGGMSGGGMGFIFAPARRAEAQDRLQAIMDKRRPNCKAPCPLPWSRWFTISPSMKKGRGPTFSPAATRCCRRIITRWSCRNCSNWICKRCRPCAGRSWINLPPPAGTNRSWAAWCRTFSTACSRN